MVPLKWGCRGVLDIRGVKAGVWYERDGQSSFHQPTNTPQGIEHIRKALQACSFPPWGLNSLQCKHNIYNGQNSTENQPNNNNSGTNNNKNISLVPCIHGLGERFKRTCNSRGIQVHFKGTNTIKSSLWLQRTGTANYNSRVIYKFKCPHINCLEEYVGESGRPYGDRLKDHLRTPSPIIATPQDTQSALNALPLLTGSHRGSQGTSRRLCTSM